MLRIFTALCVAFAALCAGQAAAQGYDLGERQAGQTYPVSLSAHNADCPEALDFRFVFEPGSWLRPRGEAIVRGVPTGATRPLPVIVDLSQSAPGDLTTRVDVVCDNCQASARCTIDRQSLTISVTAVSATPAPTQPPTATRPPGPRPAPPASAAPPQPAPPLTQPSATTAAPAPGPSTTSGAANGADTATAACERQLNTAYAAAVIAILAALGCGFWAMSARNAARFASDGKTTAPDGRLRTFLQERAEELQELSVNCRQDLLRLANAQIGALRALSALGLIQHDANAADIEAWSRVASGAGVGLSSAGAAVIGKGEASLSAHIEQTANTHPDARPLFAPLDAMAPVGPRLAWLRERGFARDDTEAQNALNEIANIFANAGAGDVVARLEEAAAECAQADAELAAAIAQAAAG
jgi:hypothetical protein